MQCLFFLSAEAMIVVNEILLKKNLLPLLLDIKQFGEFT